MKNTNTCPKCQSRDIVRIEGKAGAYGAGNNIPVGATIFSAIKVTRFLCCNCGFSEEWIEAREGLERLRKKFRRQNPQ